MNDERGPLEQLAIQAMNDKATAEEVAYLESHFPEHRAALVGVIKRNEALRVRLQSELDADEFREHELELKQRIAKAGSFIRRIEYRLTEINAHRKAHPEIKVPAPKPLPTHKSPSEAATAKKIALAHIKGWGAATMYFDARLREGLTQDQAREACISYARIEKDRLKELYATDMEREP